MKFLKSPLSVRGDSVYCPLALSLDSYWNCLTDCNHCYLRFMNRTWGQELRPIDPEELRKKLINGLKNKTPNSPLAHCLSRKKTIRWGNKSDPFQKVERHHQIAPHVFQILESMEWSFVIQTMHTDVMMDYRKEILQCAKKNLITVMPVISPGLDMDWEILERKRTNKPNQKISHLKWLISKGVPVGVNGEPFIPGFHTEKDFENVIRLLKENGIPSYNTYNLHLNEYVAKKLHGIGLDIEKIWFMNKDEQWKPILQKLLDIAKKYGIRLGCPDFVNTGPNWKEQANTCCGINVLNPMTYNTHVWKRMVQEGKELQFILESTYDGSGDKNQAESIIYGKESSFYTLKDSGVI